MKTIPGRLTGEPADRPRIKLRIEALSDIVFGLALSIGSLILIGNIPRTPSDLGIAVLLFSFSFFLVVLSWLGYTRIMSVLPAEVNGVLVLTILLLLCVALEPYMFFVMQTTDPSFLYWASFGYALDVGAMYLILAVLTYLLLLESRRPQTELKVHPFLLARFKGGMRAYLALGIVFLVSALPFFWTPTPVGYLRFDLWYFSGFSLLFWIPSRRRARES